MAAPPLMASSKGLNGNGAVAGVCIMLVVMVFLVFGQTLRFGFVSYGDGDYFFSNPHVEAGLSWNSVRWAFQAGYASNWHPLTWLSLMLDAQLFGPGPTAPHLTNVILHAANAVLLFLVLLRLTGLHSEPSSKTSSPPTGKFWPSDRRW